jgi:hypothetical protein
MRLEPGELRCAFEEEGGCRGLAEYTVWCKGHGHKVLGHLCSPHETRVRLAEENMSCGQCAAEGHRCEVFASYDHQLDAPWAGQEPVWTEPVPLYPAKFATTEDAAWWGRKDGRADHARFPGGLATPEEAPSFLELLGEDPALNDQRQAELVSAYRTAWARGLEWLDAALPYTIGYACECGCDGRDHGAVWGAVDREQARPLQRGRCTSCRRCREFRRAPKPVKAPGSEAPAAVGQSLPGELVGDSPYKAAVAALGTYVHEADAQHRATETLEASLTVHGFDRDQVFMGHVVALREATARLQARVRGARAVLFTNHAAGDEYHVGGQDAAASAFRTDVGQPARPSTRAEGNAS